MPVPVLISEGNKVMKGKINYSESLFNRLKTDFRKDILQSTESSKEMRDEIKRVFQMANRRIQNVEKSGLYSPAVEALNVDYTSGYSKFSVSGKSWVELKIDYGKAISFLRQPTSTASGSRQYNEHIRKSYDLSKDEYKMMMDNIKGRLDSIENQEYVERYLMHYKDFSGELEQAARDVSDQLETDAEQLSNALQDEIERQADDASEQMTDEVKRIYDQLKEML